ncbi:helix-turn-helix domain-containing protein [Ensifer sp. Root31]|uniref:helix-turn-helix domain-containing protein n=1 Tax=Ensifer sp. Root31 TaxID=1736512 RepID=UPI000AB30D40|nr:helix-turn-helix domain-containing protein [Ensifer sp. Root31]
MKKDRPLGIKEIAHELGCSTKTVRRYHASGKLKTFRIGDGASPIKMRSIDLKRHLEKRDKSGG